GLAEPTATVAAVVAPSATPALDLFVDEFEEPGSGWDIYDVEGASAGYEAGEYQISLTQTDWMAWANPPPMNLGDYEIQVDVRAVHGPIDNSFGLVVRYQPDTSDYYWFRASIDGYYSVVLYTNRESTVLVDWQES